jgi:hypothetical protein
MLGDIKSWLRFNERLAADYPEVCIPIRALGGIPHRARAQTAFGKPTMIEWGVDRLRLPDCPRVLANGKHVPADSASAIVDCDGITGDIRGHSVATTSGQILRPDLALCDDPQTRESAKSTEQTKDRLATIQADVAQSAGPGSPMTVLALVTIIYRNDLADQLLQSKEWRPVKAPMVLSWPKNIDMWEHPYNEARLAGIEADDEGKRARAFIRANKAALYDGAAVSWPQRYDAGELDGIQHAMNLYLKYGKKAFFSEYQLEPLEEVATIFELPRDLVAKRTNGLESLQAPENAASIFCQVDINADGLRWAIGSASNLGAVNVLAYGIHPGNGGMLIPDKASEAVSIMRGLTGLDAELSALSVMRGLERMPIDLVLLDCGGTWMQTVFDWLGTSAKRSGLPWLASRGWSANSYAPSRNRIGRPGERWHMARWPGKGKVIVFDNDFWRHRQQRGWLIPVGTPDSIALFGDGKVPHTEFADGVVCERLAAMAETDKGTLYKWTMAKGSRNDWGDVATGLYVAASKLGLSAGEEGGEEKGGKRKKAKRVPQVLINRAGG